MKAVIRTTITTKRGRRLEFVEIIEKLTADNGYTTRIYCPITGDNDTIIWHTELDDLDQYSTVAKAVLSAETQELFRTNEWYEIGLTLANDILLVVE